MLEKKTDGRPASVEDLEQVLTLQTLGTVSLEIGDLLAKGADQFLETADRLGWVEARLDAYRAEVLHDELGSIAWSMCILVSERFEIGEDHSRRILESRLHDAIEDVKIHVSVAPAHSAAAAASGAVGNLSDSPKGTEPERLFREPHRQALARLIWLNQRSSDRELFKLFQDNFKHLVRPNWKDEPKAFADTCTRIKRKLRKYGYLPQLVNRH